MGKVFVTAHSFFMNSTKIVCTLGPSSGEKQVLKKLMAAGMNVARLNFSHGTYQSHRELISHVHAAAKEKKLPVALMQDLQGPRIRVGSLPHEGVKINKNEKVLLVSESYYKKNSLTSQIKLIPIQFPKLHENVKKGNRILIADGVIELVVREIRAKNILCVVQAPGVVLNQKGINVPKVFIRGSVLTQKDRKDIAFGVQNNVDYVAVSFVKNADDILEVRKILARLERRKIPKTKIIAKIERQEAIDHFDEILAASDAIMIARGDLGVELPPEEVPVLQKKLIVHCLASSKPVIVATQMLESMTNSARPTRAEVSDVANAVIDHTDATMLSGETASGLFPVKAVEIMARTIAHTEESAFDDFDYREFCYAPDIQQGMNIFFCSLEKALAQYDVRTIVAHVTDLTIARLLSSLRLMKKNLVVTSDPMIYRQLSLFWGIQAVFLTRKNLQPKNILTQLKESRLIGKNEQVLFFHEQGIEKKEQEFFTVM